MKTRAVFPFAAGSPTIAEAPDPSARQAGTKYSLPPGVTIRALVSCIASYRPGAGGSGQLRLAPTSPLELTGSLPGWETIGIDAIVLEELDSVITQVAPILTTRSNVPRKTIPSGKSKAEPSIPAQWAAGAQSVYLERGATIWVVPPGGIEIRLCALVAQGSVEILLDGDALLHAINDAGGFATNAGPPSGFAFGVANKPLQGVGPRPATDPGIDTVECAATHVEVYGPPSAAAGPLPPDVAYLSPGSGAITLSLAAGATATWTAAASDATTLSTSAASGSTGSTQIELPANSWWGSADSLTVTITATLSDNSTFSLDVPALEHAPVSDSGRASRTDIPSSAGSPRVSILASDLPTAPPITSFGNAASSGGSAAATITVTVDGTSAADVTPSPAGDRLFFAAPPVLTAGTYDIGVTINGTSTTLVGAISYTDDIVAGLEGLKASLAVAAEEAALIAETFVGVAGTDELRVCCETLRWHIGSFQLAVATVGEVITPGDSAGEAAWSALLTEQATLIVDIVNSALAALSSPPIASLDGNPVAGTDERPDYDVAAFVVAVTSLDNVIVRSAHALGEG